MGLRVVKHIGARSTPTDLAKALIIVPTFPGEKVKVVRLSAYFASGDDSSIDQPGEVNWYGLSIPWQLVFTTGLMFGASLDIMDTVATWDELFRDWLRGPDDTQLYGGDVELDKEEVASEEDHSSEELLDSGPIGVHKWFSREELMQPFAAEGNNVIRFGDSFRTVIQNVPVAAMGGVLMFGMVRYEAVAQTNFNVQLDDATAREAFGLLLGGDYTKVGAKVEGDTGAIGDYLRTVLYGGDNYVEADTLKGPAGKAVVKAQVVIETAMGRAH